MNWKPFTGTITMIHDMITEQNSTDNGCYKLMAVENDSGNLVHFIVSPTTYVLNHVRLAVGDNVTGYYDGDAPAPLLYPPRYAALVLVKHNPNEHVKVDYFNANLISSDGQLGLNLTQTTPMVLTNGQPFVRNPANRSLMVIYGPATKSIPAWTTPDQIIVLCI